MMTIPLPWLSMLMQRAALLAGLFLAMAILLPPAANAQLPLAKPEVLLHEAGDIRTLARQLDGKLLVGGAHQLAGRDGGTGFVASGKLHRLNTDGSVDLAFRPAPDGNVLKVVTYGAHAYVLGEFSSIGGQAISRLAKISLADGSAVATWNPAPDGNVWGMDIDASGNVYVVGSFAAIGGGSRNMLAKLDATTGQLLPAWNPFVPLEPGQTIQFTNVAVNGSAVYVSGTVNADVDGLFGRLYRFDTALGARDAAFAPAPAAINHESNNPQLAFDGAGNVYMGGPGGAAIKVGQDNVRKTLVILVKLLAATGQQDVSWPVSTEAVTALATDATSLYVAATGQRLLQDTGGGPIRIRKLSTANGAPVAGWSYPESTGNGWVAAMVPTPEGVVVGGIFAGTGSQFTPALARLDTTTGQPEAAWKGGAFVAGAGVVVQPMPDGKLLLGGRFHLVNFERRAHLARLNADGSLDTSFDTNADGSVWQLMALGGSIYVGGLFTRIGGQQIQGAARIDAATGAVDPAWAPNPDGGVRRMGTDGTSVFISGPFDKLGNTTLKRLAKLSPTTGTPDPAFLPPLADLATSCIGTFGMAVANGWAYLGCQRSVSGVPGPRVERYSTTTGVVDSAWNPQPNGRVRTILVSGGHVYLLGEFTTIGGQSKARVGRVSESNGALDAAWGNLAPASGILYAANIIGNHFYAGGYLDVSGGGLGPNLFRMLATTGALDQTWAPGFDSTGTENSFGVQSIVADPSGTGVLVAGSIARVAGTVRLGLASLSPNVATTAPAIASAERHSLAVTTEGKVLAWGNDSHGQLGVGRSVIRPTPAAVTGLPTITQVSLSSHALAVDSFKRVWAWGDNACGQLGPRDSAVASKPARVQGVTNVVMAGAGSCFSVALRSDGTVWGWGTVPGYGVETTPRQLSGLAGIAAIAVGPQHVLARRSDGAVFAFGDNTLGQLGNGALGGTSAAAQVAALSGATAIAASAGRSMALLTGGQLRLWGIGVATPVALPAPPEPAAAIALSGAPYVLRVDGAVDQFNGSAWVAAFTGAAGLAKLAAGGVLLGINGSGQLYASGDNSRGMLGQGNTTAQSAAVTVPGFTSTSSVVASDTAVLAVRADGSLWFWGQDIAGESGDGGAIGSSVPRAVTIAGSVRSVAAGRAVSVALDASGTAWVWGTVGKLIAQSTPVNILTGLTSGPSAGGTIRGVAAGQSFVAILGDDGTVYSVGTTAFGAAATANLAQAPGFAGIVQIVAGEQALYGLALDGKVWAAGPNSLGQLGNGSTVASTTAVQVQGISGVVRRISAGGNRAGAITSDGKVWMWGGGPLGNGGRTNSSVALQVAGITDAVELSVGSELAMVLRSDGSVLAWGDAGLAGASGRDPLVPYSVTLGRTPQAVSAGDGSSLGFIIDTNGVAWGFGKYGRVTASNASIGDGAYVSRDRPVLVLAASGAGSVDSNDWYLDLDPATTQTVPAASTPKTLGVAQVSGADSGLVVDATIKYRTADYGKSINNYVLGLVPTNFFGLVKTSPGISSPAKLAAKAKNTGGFVLAQLTPAGWTDVSGQLIAYSQGTANAAGNAANILSGINASSIPGARFCIGYGESSGSMLSAGSLTEVLSLEGASSSASGVPCVLTGIYVDGPSSSIAGTSVSFKASVVGLSPTGSVQFTDAGANLSSPVTLAVSSDAVGSSSLGIATLTVGSHSIGATYGGNAQNAAVAAEVPLLHQVVAAAPGASATTLTGPSSSELGSEVAFTATVAGNSPTGTVQFKDGATNLGAAVPLVGSTATVRTSTLAQGSHSITAVYSGDGGNATSTSSAIAHTVAGAIETTVTLTSSSESSSLGGSVTFTATVTGTNPTGNVIFRNGATVIGTVALQNGVATLAVSNFVAGQHVITAEYAGDGTNQPVTSTAIFQQVSIPTTLSPSPVAVEFGGQSMNTTGPAQSLTFTNTGNTALTVTSVTASTYFAVSHTCTSVAAGGTCSATVTFTPAAQGPLNGTLTLVTSAGVVSVGLSGTGEKSLTTHYYLSILRRAPDAGGKAFWDAEAGRVQALGVNVNEVWFAMAQSFFGSAEYLAFARDNAGFVTDLYTTFFNRAPDQAGLDYWKGQLDQGLPREVALAGFMFSAEFAGFTQAIFGTTVTRKELDTVVDFFRGLLGRLPDDGGFNFWLAQFRTAQCAGGAAVNAQVESISSQFALGAEYAARARTASQYVGDLYNAFLRRGGDLAGVQFWINQVSTGAQTREQVRQAFVASPEFQARVAAIIAQGCLQ